RCNSYFFFGLPLLTLNLPLPVFPFAILNSHKVINRLVDIAFFVAFEWCTDEIFQSMRHINCTCLALVRPCDLLHDVYRFIVTLFVVFWLMNITQSRTPPESVFQSHQQCVWPL